MIVRLVPMTEVEFQAYLALAVADYAQEHVKAGNWQPSEALQKSEQEFKELLPDGPASKNQYLFSIEDAQSGLNVGMIWFALNTSGPRPTAFIYDFRVQAEQRGRGYGSAALKALDEKAASLGIATLSLHVFAHNPTAIGLYKKMGYEITDLHMSKKIGA